MVVEVPVVSLIDPKGKLILKFQGDVSNVSAAVLKQKLRGITGIPEKEQVLKYNGLIFHDGARIAEVNWRPGEAFLLESAAENPERPQPASPRPIVYEKPAVVYMPQSPTYFVPPPAPTGPPWQPTDQNPYIGNYAVQRIPPDSSFWTKNEDQTPVRPLSPIPNPHFNYSYQQRPIRPCPRGCASHHTLTSSFTQRCPTCHSVAPLSRQPFVENELHSRSFDFNSHDRWYDVDNTTLSIKRQQAELEHERILNNAYLDHRLSELETRCAADRVASRDLFPRYSSSLFSGRDYCSPLRQQHAPYSASCFGRGLLPPSSKICSYQPQTEFTESTYRRRSLSPTLDRHPQEFEESVRITRRNSPPAISSSQYPFYVPQTRYDPRERYYGAY